MHILPYFCLWAMPKFMSPFFIDSVSAIISKIVFSLPAHSRQAALWTAARNIFLKHKCRSVTLWLKFFNDSPELSDKSSHSRLLYILSLLWPESCTLSLSHCNLPLWSVLFSNFLRKTAPYMPVNMLWLACFHLLTDTYLLFNTHLQSKFLLDTS